MKKFPFLFLPILLLSILATAFGCNSTANTAPPSTAEEYYNRGIALFNESKYDEAIKEYTKAIVIDPGYTDAYIHRGSVYVIKTQYDLAIDDCSKAITLDPKNAYAYCTRGIAYKSRAQNDLAIADFKKVVELSTDPEVVRNAKKNISIATDGSGYILER
jgi:Tfp pilus assembly protein PilF